MPEIIRSFTCSEGEACICCQTLSYNVKQYYVWVKWFALISYGIPREIRELSRPTYDLCLAHQYLKRFELWCYSQMPSL